MANFTRIQTSSGDVNRLQDSVVTALNQLGSGPFLGGNLLSATAVGTGVTAVAHKLTYTPTVLFTGPPSTNTTVWNPQASDNLYVYLQAASPCTLSIWVK